MKAHHDSPYGRIVSNWKREGDLVTMHITTTSLACLAMLPGTMVLAASDPIPFPDALDDAAIVQATIDDVDSKAMIVGNGDIKSLWKNLPRSFYPLPKSTKTNPPPR